MITRSDKAKQEQKGGAKHTAKGLKDCRSKQIRDIWKIGEMKIDLELHAAKRGESNAFSREIPEKIISLKDVAFSYDEQGANALNGVSLDIKKGEYVALVGHNGSGKSTLAKLLNGLISAKEGQVVVCGVALEESSTNEEIFFVRRNVGMVFQNPDNQMVASIIEDDVAFGPENLGLKREDIIERVEFALNSVGMYDYRMRAPNKLSGGQKQRVAIAGVLALKPEIMVLDESTSMLDPQGRDEVLKIVKKLNKEKGKTVVHITHFMDEVADADRVIMLKKGKIVFSGTPYNAFLDEELINECGLEVPRVQRLAGMLRNRGMKLPDRLFSAAELGEEIAKQSNH